MRTIFPLPHPGSTSLPGVRPRPGPSRLAMPCARRLPLLVAAPAPPRALQTFCSCHLGRQLLGAMLLGAACICASGILNAGPWLPGLCAPHDESLLVCLPPGRRACEPCMHMQTWHSPAVGLSPVLERDPFVVVVCRHPLATPCYALHRSPVPYVASLLAT